jgi:hypothetical protein
MHESKNTSTNGTSFSGPPSVQDSLTPRPSIPLNHIRVYGAMHACAWAYTPAVDADAAPTGLVRDFSGVPRICADISPIIGQLAP